MDRECHHFDGDRLIGESSASPWGFIWNEVPSGAHPVWAEWTDAAGKGSVANPAMIAVRFRP